MIREQQAAEQSFKRDAAALVDRLDKTLRLSQQTVGSMVAFYDATEENTRSEFHLFAHRLLENSPALQSLQWVPRIPNSYRYYYEETAQSDFSGFRFSELNSNGQFVIANDREFYYPVYYIEPYAGNESMLGFDYGSTQNQVAALMKAAQTAKAVATWDYQLPSQSDQLNGLLIFEPVYQKNTMNSLSLPDISNIEGFVFVVIDLSKLIEQAINSHDKANFSLMLQDLTIPANNRHLYYNGFYHDSETPDRKNDHSRFRKELVYSNYLSFADRVWQATVTPSNYSYSLAPSLYAWIIFISCLGITFFVALTLYISKNSQHILQLSNSNLLGLTNKIIKTQKALKEEKERALVTLSSINDAVITTNEKGEIDYANPVAENMFGISLSIDLGKPVASLLQYIGDQSTGSFEGRLRSISSSTRKRGYSEQCILVANKDKQLYVEESFSPIIDSQGVIKGSVLVFSDVTEKSKYNREIAYQASHDQLTGLVNRREFEIRLKHAVHGAANRSSKHILCFIDLDQFKSVNDTSGHIAGDALLKELSNLLCSEIRDRDTLARIGGDEFALLLDNCHLEDGINISESIILLINKYRFFWQGNIYHIGASIGLVEILSGDTTNIETLISHADQACNAAKLAGRNQVNIYSHDKSNPPDDNLLFKTDIMKLVTDNRIQLFYQQIVALDNNAHKINRYEILIRMLGTNGQIILPGAFLPAAERNGQMVTLDRWVISNALKSIPATFKHEPQAVISLNISSSTLNDSFFCKYILDLIDNTNIEPKRLCFEIKETAVMQRSGKTLEFLHELKKRGCSIALDNFGSGISTMSNIKHLPIDLIKIDGHFIQNIDKDNLDHAVVRSIQEISRVMGISTVAECVNNLTIVDILRHLGIDYAQGYVLSKPKKMDLCH